MKCELALCYKCMKKICIGCVLPIEITRKSGTGSVSGSLELAGQPFRLLAWRWIVSLFLHFRPRCAVRRTVAICVECLWLFVLRILVYFVNLR